MDEHGFQYGKMKKLMWILMGIDGLKWVSICKKTYYTGFRWI